MKNLKINKRVIFDRLKLIEKYLRKLKELQALSHGQFSLEDNFALASYYLRCALEATFDICAHILARIPGAYVGEYKGMALEMGKQKIIPQEFAGGKLYEMAGFRNRLTHFYDEVTPEEMYNIIQNDLGDFGFFMKCIKKLIT